ncbi:hypothetical protein TNCV_3060381 [Trichonephila clavipes]|uniref:Uncharacterized protein n=1 Tax=Trichonephila clavipes TaxID=2585209 RepID=A0A8X6W0P5_TRICX|nr:hypothetical protein TNCV_3060381 [Trichonephila clavipes]
MPHINRNDNVLVSQQPMNGYFEWVRDLESLLAMATREYPLCPGRSGYEGKHAVLYCRVERGRFRGPEERAQLPALISQKSNLAVQITYEAKEKDYSCTQWLFILK